MSQEQARRHARWQTASLQRGWAARRRLPLAVLYGALVWMRRLAYRLGWLKIRRLPVPVVVVGNVVAGGAGKTPTVLALAEHLQRQGWNPGVVSRGHGRQGMHVLEVTPDTPATLGGDEPVLIRRRGQLPVYVGADRAAAGLGLLQAHPDVNVILCDDGLQHLALHRDVEVVVFDERGVGNGWLLPAGLLREPWPPRSPSTSPVLMLRQYRDGRPPPHVEIPEGMACFDGRRRLARHAVDLDGRRVPLADLAGLPVVTVAGLAQPQRFFAMLAEQGIRGSTEMPLPDHAPASDYAEALSHSLPVICTEKDLAKLAQVWHPGSPPVWAIPLELDMDAAFFAALDTMLPPHSA